MVIMVVVVELPLPLRLLSLPSSLFYVYVRTGPPVDDAADYTLPVWAGVLPTRVVACDPIPDPKLKPGTPLPSYLQPLPPPAR